jgi:L-alanine-DL-glutamate epimerase-like enolase superfamily enzyme
MIEWPHLDLEATILGDALTAKNSRAQVPQCPGLGIDPDPDVISTYQLKN